MNTKFLALAIASVAVATVSANDATCPNSEITKLGRLALSANLQPCQDQSGYSFVPPSALPNAEQQAKLCASKECKALIKEVIAFDPSDCKFLGILNVHELAFKFDDTCAKIAGTPVPAPAATTAAPAVTPAPAATTASPGAAPVPAPSTGTPVPTATKPVC